MLLDSVRGEHKLPGEFRRSQNWIGGSSPADAMFVPPHHQYVEALMGDLENFLHNDQINVPALIRIGIAHYQFETIHPFLDGNGRIGRLLITLFLVEKGILNQPLLYLSTFFERNKALYYDNLTFVRTQNNMIQWLKYFLAGIEETARQSAETLSGVLQLKADYEQRVQSNFGRRAHKALHLLQHLFQHPIIGVQEAAAITGVTFKAANELVAGFVKQGMLKETTGQTRNRMFVLEEYVQKFRAGT
jgi:Fic family protein